MSDSGQLCNRLISQRLVRNGVDLSVHLWTLRRWSLWSCELHFTALAAVYSVVPAVGISVAYPEGMKKTEEGSMRQNNDKTEKTTDRQEEVIATLINPIHVFSGAVSPRDYITAQKQLLRDFGEDIYFNWQLEILHAEIASIIEEIKLESSEPRPNTNVVGQA